MRNRTYAALAAAPFALSALATPAAAEHWDVIAFEMTGKCSFEKYMAIVKDFNDWGAEYGYNAKVAMPLQSDNLATWFWVGSSEGTAAFGAAWDAWRDGQADEKSTPAKLQARFEECSTNMQRTGYDIFQ